MIPDEEKKMCQNAHQLCENIRIVYGKFCKTNQMMAFIGGLPIARPEKRREENVST